MSMALTVFMHPLVKCGTMFPVLIYKERLVLMDNGFTEDNQDLSIESVSGEDLVRCVHMRHL